VERNSHVELSPLIELGNVNSVRNLVIQALGEEWPLNVRKLHTKIERQRPGVSYHAVHKALQQLVSEGIIKREEMGYLIDTSWVERALALLDGMKSCKCGMPLYLPGLKDFKEGDSKTFYFETLAEADKYRKRLQLEYAQTQPKKPYIVIARHARSALLYSEKTLAFPAVQLQSIPRLYLIAGKTVPDEWCADYYRLQGAYVRTGVDCAHSCDTRVVGDVIEQLYVPEDTMQMMTKMFSGTNNISELNVPDFHQSICLRKSPVKFVVMHNTDLAEQIRQQVLANFETSKIAVLTLDGTFVDVRFPIEATKWLVSKGILNGTASSKLLKLCENFEQGQIPRDVFVLEHIKLFSKALQGVSPEKLQASVKTFVETDGSSLFLKYAKKLFNFIKSYRKVVVATHLPLEFAKALGFDSDNMITTTFEVDNGKFTGKILQNMLTPDAKDNSFKNWLDSDPNIDMNDSVGIGSRHHDIAFLNKVAFPIVINPDRKLEAIAKRKGWFIYDGDTDRLTQKISEVVLK